MAWRKRVNAPIEPPAWYRSYDPAMWDEPDGQEQRMIDGHRGYPWPAELHEIHAHRRWAQAKHEYRGQHPDLAEQEFEALLNRDYGRDSRPGFTNGRDST